MPKTKKNKKTSYEKCKTEIINFYMKKLKRGKMKLLIINQLQIKDRQ